MKERAHVRSVRSHICRVRYSDCEINFMKCYGNFFPNQTLGVNRFQNCRNVSYEHGELRLRPQQISFSLNTDCRAVRGGVGATMGDPGTPKFKSITHVLFDMDGLLLDTEKFYTIVQENILARYGKHFDWSLKAKMMGKKALDAAQTFVKETGLEGILTPEEFIRQREEMLHDLFPETELMPGVERLIRHLHAHRVPMAVATSSHRRHYDLKTTKHKELFSLMHHVVVGDHLEVKQGKPSPDIFLVAAKKFEDGLLQREKVLVLEDAPTGVVAARNAGMSVVMVPDPNLDRSLCQGADQVLSSLVDFVPDHWGLPPYPEP